ncbi:MAG: class I tRNA ligase family protein [bacterium]
MFTYNHKKVDKKWQSYWNKKKVYETKDGKAGATAKKCYILDMFPYPSGDGLHVGHPKGYIATDIFSRFKRMTGHNVLHPMGFDAFGLPAENYAIKNKVNPEIAVKKNVKKFKDQLAIIGLDYDWSRTVNTTDPEYYRWTQWIFLQMFKKGLAFESFEPINWCPSCKTGLANEDLDGTKCERCGTEIEHKPMRQWVLEITKYADRLLYDLDDLNWPESIKELQRNWIGRSEGSELTFKVQNSNEVIKVFTTRPDTLYGVTYVVVAPENKLVQALKPQITNWKEIEKYLKTTKAKTELERTADNKEKSGVELKGVKVIHPITGETVPVFAADYVLAGYGTGAVMAVPAHDDRDYAFAVKYNLPLKEVIIPERIDKRNPPVAGKEKVERQNVQVVVRNPKDGKILYIKYKKFGWHSFPMGGIDGGELLAAAAREVMEETGYKNLTNGKVLGGQVRAEYFAAHKDVNRVSYTNLVSFDLENEERVPVSEKEAAEADYFWADMKDMTCDFMCHAEMDVWLDRLNNGTEKAYCEDGVMVNSDKFNGRKNTEIMEEITKLAGGKRKVTYRLKDWVFSRQRYWGEPIPLVHCEHCAQAKFTKEAKLTVNFYYKDVWTALNNGTKTVETRALNPEEQNRYFGNVKVGDILNFEYKKEKGGKTIEQKCVRVKGAKIYKTFADLFADKDTLSKLHIKKYSSVIDLEKSYSTFGDDYMNKIIKNGLVAWEIEPVTIPVPVPEKDLPLKLPKVKSYEPSGTGESPLAKIDKWVNTKCPVCKGKAKRETNTMPQWAGSSWYYLRYIDPKNKKALIDSKKEKFWMKGGVDMYVGGTEHATRHLIYARFWHKFLFDIGVVSTKEPFAQLRNQGMILGADNRKMSKRWGNVVNPDDVVANFGADALRVYEMFMGPFAMEAAWSTDNLIGSRRFLERFAKLQDNVTKNKKEVKMDEVEMTIHRTVKKVTEDIAEFNFNTAVSSMMIAVNELLDKKILAEHLEMLVKVLAPFAPHLTEEIWQTTLKKKKTIHLEKWPTWDPKKIISNKTKIAVQVNGKVRETIEFNSADVSEADAKEKAIQAENVKRWLVSPIKKIIYIKNKILNIVI